LPRLAQQKMNVVRHNDVSINAKHKTATDTFKCRLKDSSVRVTSEKLMTMVAAKRHEMALSSLVKALQSPRHEGNLLSKGANVCDE